MLEFMLNHITKLSLLVAVLGFMPSSDAEKL